MKTQMEISIMVAKFKEVHVMQNKPKLQIVICKLQTTITPRHRRNDIIYTDVASYKTYFDEYSKLIQSEKELFTHKNDSTFEYILTKPYPQPDIFKQLPNNLTSENFIQKIAQEIWNIPDNQIDEFEYVIYLGH